ncbi:DUF5134 domain-containing protein [Streptomyces sp. SAI-127]|uniref:DUF5134 domain-containing protein n=1 Tax=Streptomyces sp. SAI-127 TaxID=2940543 RepID=UPI0024768171|nr:DUF5134 domain-containing protein [Streptomyces sp. SAI-127]MDH6492949.1 hypothetical protein [Streptomyces sp. SAI-127]
MGSLTLSWSIAVVATLVTAVSAVRMMTTSGEARFAAGGDLLMGLCMVAMSLPATAAWYGGYGLWWSAAFSLLGTGAVALAVKSTRERGWKEGRHWVHLIVGSAGMVLMTLAMTNTSSGPVLALGHHGMAGTPGMEHAAGMQHAADTAGSAHVEAMPGMSGHGLAAGAEAASPSVWRFVVAALAVYFLLSIAASVRVRVRDAGRSSRADGRESARRSGWGRWLLTMPDTVVVFLASLALSVWDRARTTGGGRHGGRRRRIGAAPEAALAAHIGMGGTMSAMLLMMAV